MFLSCNLSWCFLSFILLWLHVLWWSIPSLPSDGRYLLGAFSLQIRKVFLMTNRALGVDEGCWSLSQISQGEGKQGTSRTRHQFIAEPTQKNSSQSPNLLWAAGGNCGTGSELANSSPRVRMKWTTSRSQPISRDHGQRATPQRSQRWGSLRCSGMRLCLQPFYEASTKIHLSYSRIFSRRGLRFFPRDNAATSQRSVASVAWERSPGLAGGERWRLASLFLSYRSNTSLSMISWLLLTLSHPS